MVTVCMIWQATFGNGARIGMVVAKASKCGVGALGTLLLISSVLLPPTTAVRTLDTTTVGFAACQDLMGNRISHLPHLA